MISLLSLIFTGNPQDLQKLYRDAEMRLKLKPAHVFSEQEQSYLSRNGKHGLAQSFSISLNEKDLPKIENEIRKNHYKIRFEYDQKVTPRQNDPYQNEQWGLKNSGRAITTPLSNQHSVVLPGIEGEDVRLPESLRSKKTVVVAVIDSGVDIEHEDLKDAIARKPEECQALEQYNACLKKDSKKKCDETWLAVDTDKNGYPLDCAGWNFLGPKNPISKQYGTPVIHDDIGHGTHVAGIIAAQKNSKGIVGVAPETKILPIQVISEDPSAGDGSVVESEEDYLKATKLTQTVARGILYATQSQADIINLSLGWNGRADSPLVAELIKTAREKNILVVAAAGNDGTDALAFPCQYSNVICVGAHNPNGSMSEFSNHGSGVDIAAPGISILSTIPTELTAALFTDEKGYDFKEGTSMATPFVSGALATLLSQNIPPQEAFVKLLIGARTRPFVEKRTTLRGNLDIQGALSSSLEPLFVPEQKGALPFLWDGISANLPISIALKNLGSDARNVRIKLLIPDKLKAQRSIEIPASSFHASTWNAQETKEIPFTLKITDPKVSSDLVLTLVVGSEGQSDRYIRLPLQISLALEKQNPPPNSVTIPIVSGEWIGNEETGRPTLLTIESLDQNPFQDYLAILYGEENWTIQLVRETAQGYVLGTPKTMPAAEGAIRALKRLDLNFDDKSEYVFTYLISPPAEEGPSDGEPKAVVPYFRFDWLDETLQDVYPSYTFQNKTTVLNLDKFQWIKSGIRLVPAWSDFGKIPIAERPTKYNYWDPNPDFEKRGIRFRIYYHDPLTADGVRSIPLGLKQKPFALLQQSKDDIRNGTLQALLAESEKFGDTYSVLMLNDVQTTGLQQKFNLFPYRNLSAAESSKVFSLNSSLTSSSLSFIGSSQTQSQRVTALLQQADHWGSRNFTITPPSGTQFAYRVIGSFLDFNTNLSAYVQSDYDVLYKESSQNQVFETSLQRYTFLPSSIFERSFVPVVAESNGERLAALQIPDGFGAYPGAEIIAPLKTADGQTIDLIKPAKLRIQIADEDCDWLKSLGATVDQPSQAVYFCGDRFIRIPYRF